MNLFDDIKDFKPINKNQLRQHATKLIGRRKTRRAKKKKKTKPAQWTKEFNEAMKIQKQMKKERAEQFSDFERLIEKE